MSKREMFVLLVFLGFFFWWDEGHEGLRVSGRENADRVRELFTSNGILLFWPVSLKAWARRKTSSTPTPRARNGSTCAHTGNANKHQPFCNRIQLEYIFVQKFWCCTWVVAALKEMPMREQRPSPAATDRVTSSTPASPTAPWDLAQSQRNMVRHA